MKRKLVHNILASEPLFVKGSNLNKAFGEMYVETFFKIAVTLLLTFNFEQI